MSVIENVGLLLSSMVLGPSFPSHIVYNNDVKSKSSNKQFPAHPQPIPLLLNLIEGYWI